MAQHASNTLTDGTPTPNIWRQMSYPAPRGPCLHKTSLMTPTCACLRFMIHPVRAGTSFECDGCAHHASFHKMENRAEDEIVARWRAEEKTKEEERRRVGENVEDRFHEAVGGGSGPDGLRKRRRLEGAEVGGGATLSGLVGRGGSDLMVTGTGVNARRPTGIKKGQLKGIGRRVVDLEAEQTV